MSLYNADITIVNNTEQSLVLDASASSGLGDGNWPLIIKAGASPVVNQAGNVNLNFTAVYALDGNREQEVSMHYYLAVFGAGAMHMNMFGTGVSFGPDSSITENMNGTPVTNNSTLDIWAGPSGLNTGLQTLNYTVGLLS